MNIQTTTDERALIRGLEKFSNFTNIAHKPIFDVDGNRAGCQLLVEFNTTNDPHVEVSRSVRKHLSGLLALVGIHVDHYDSFAVVSLVHDLRLVASTEIDWLQ